VQKHISGKATSQALECHRGAEGAISAYSRKRSATTKVGTPHRRGEATAGL
jgi:hypothetical protein